MCGCVDVWMCRFVDVWMCGCEYRHVNREGGPTLPDVNVSQKLSYQMRVIKS